MPLGRLKERQAELLAEANEIVALADEENRDLTDDELADVEKINADIESVRKQISARERLAPVAASGSRRRTSAEPDPAPTARQAPPGRAVVHASVRDPRDAASFGYQNLGEFAELVARASRGDNDAMGRLLNAATTYGVEGNGPDGGYLVPPEWSTAVWNKVTGDEALLARCDQMTTGRNAVVLPKDETTPWDTSSGVLCYWENEGGTKTQSKPAFEMNTLRLNKLAALVPLSDELLEDATGLDSYLRAKAPAKMTAKINTAIVRGTGVGQPLGILNAGSLISVTKETSQDADTVVYANIVNMWSRMYASCRRNAIWLINQDIEPQLYNLAFREDATSPVPAYMPAGGLSASPFGTLFGRPVVPVEACSTLGDAGDIILCDLSQYLAVVKGGGIKTDTSIHLYFDQDITAYRFVFRLAGQPWWGGTISPENGSTTRSWAVNLEARA